MSRSRKRTPICAINGAPSEKQDKRLYNRRYRHACKQHLRAHPECGQVPHLREYSNPCAMAKDGKVWFDGKRHPEWMRK